MNNNELYLINQCRKNILYEIDLIFKDIDKNQNVLDEFNFVYKNDELYSNNEILFKSCIIVLYSMTEYIDNSDIFVYLDHDKARGVLARSRYGFGSLTLALADDGLHYSFEAPKTALGDELLSYLERGEINTSSFAFSLPQEGGDRWYRDENNVLHRDIIKIERLYDCSPVFQAAYLATSVSHRKLDDIKANDEKLDLLKKEIELL